MKLFMLIMCILELIILVYLAITNNWIGLIKNVCALVGSFVCGIIYGNLNGDKDD